MILTKEIEVKINNKKSKEYYSKLGYDTKGTYNIIKPSELPKFSHIKINVKCDVCDNEKELIYSQYYKNTNGLTEEYCCSKKCSSEKCKRRLQEKYGVDNVFQLEEIKEKSKESLQEKYGVDHPMYSHEIKNKLIQTNIDRYGVEYVQMNLEIREKKENTNIKKYGFKSPLLNIEVIKKIKETLLKNYGVDHQMHSQEIKNKLIQTNIDRYGVENVFQSDDIKDKIKLTLIEKYGVNHPQHNLNIRNETIKTNLKKYGTITPSINSIVSNKIKESMIITLFDKSKHLYEEKYDITLLNHNDSKFNIKCPICNNIFQINNVLSSQRLRYNTILCTICNPIGSQSSGLEIQLLNFIKENYNGEILVNSRKIITPLELDIYLPELQLAFEFNGVYWHSDVKKESNYHKLKTDSCLEKGIQLMHIYEDDWNFKQNIIKSMILNSLNKNKLINKSKIKEIINDKLIEIFLNNNHLDGFINSDIRIGLFDKNELISLMLFKILENNKYELLRFCDKLNMNIHNSEIKLFKYFINKYKSSEIISYVDRSYNNGIIYEHLGFKLSHITNPNYKYVINGIREKCDDNSKNNIYKIYDSGDCVFKFN